MDDTINATQMLEIVVDRLLDRLLGTILDTENSIQMASIRRLEERVTELEIAIADADSRVKLQ